MEQAGSSKGRENNVESLQPPGSFSSSEDEFEEAEGSEESAARNDDEEEELERFDDFTIASSWERFISEIEAVSRQWLADGPKNLLQKGAECVEPHENLYKVKKGFKYGTKVYCMEYHFTTSTKETASYWDDSVHNMQLSFGVVEFLIIAPVSASGVVLDDHESTKLLSAVAIALSNCGSNWPAFVPVHDPSRNAYMGIQNIGTTFTRRFEADRIGSQVPVRFMHLEGLHELFLSKFVLSSTDFSTSFVKVQFQMKLTYATPPYEYDEQIVEHDPVDAKETDASNRTKTQWDDDCPWTEWYSAEDPIRGFELVAIWKALTITDSVEMAELENTSSFDANIWVIHPIVSSYMVDDSSGKFIGFASQLQLLVTALEASSDVQFMEDFVAAENSSNDNSKSASTVPPLSVLDREIKEIFGEESEDGIPEDVSSRYSRAIKGAPLRSLFAQFCLHALWFGDCNIRAIATLWIDFVREIRWFWEETESLPRMPSKCNIDLSTCLIHQKLQMLAICIERKKSLDHKNIRNHENGVQVPSSEVHIRTGDSVGKSCSTSVSDDGQPRDTQSSSDLQQDNRSRRGSAGALPSMMLLQSFQEMHAPYTQDPPILTEDMHEERAHAVEALGGTNGLSGQLEKDILSSDMAAFKAANPVAVFEDFIRWHSPGDWETDDSKNSGWPPRGKLSQRMSEHGNVWRKIWNDTSALPVSEQKPILDHIREGEKVLHYLETLSPLQLLEQMFCTAVRASADILSLTAYGRFKLMSTRLEQLYKTMIAPLKLLNGKGTSDVAELAGDLKQLCVVFEHVEKLLILAASIHRKLKTAPRLAEAAFTDYFNYYLPKMGTSLSSICYDEDFDAKQIVRVDEREAVASLFPQPTANQSWRKVLSMGNLLNGHEPTLREIIFSVHDTTSNDHYGSMTPTASTGEVETYRMYIRGTSNDLWVALSVTSWD